MSGAMAAIRNMQSNRQMTCYGLHCGGLKRNWRKRNGANNEVGRHQSQQNTEVLE